MNDSSRADERWPNFFIVGEPRSGTTSLHTWLAELDHPDLYMSEIKEPHFFATFEMPSIERSILRTTQDEAAYLDLFAPGAGRRFRGESSSYYLSDPGAAEAISSRVPHARIVAILRNPVDRAFSHYLLYGRRGAQPRTFAQTIDDILAPGAETNLAYDFVEHGRYAQHLDRYLAHFPRGQILVVLFDDIRLRPVETLRTVLTFLGLSTEPLEDGYEPAAAQNAYTQPRGRLAAALLGNERLTRLALTVVPRGLARRVRGRLLKPGAKPELDDATRATLESLYEPEIDAVARRFGVDAMRLRARARP